MADALSLVFAALADPTRREILRRLAAGEKTVSELAEPFEISMPAVTKHLKVLEKAELIERGKQAQYRPCRLNPAGLKTANEWMEFYRTFWEESFDRLESYLEELQAGEKNMTRKRKS